jgi:hypothetical protein
MLAPRLPDLCVSQSFTIQAYFTVFLHVAFTTPFRASVAGNLRRYAVFADDACCTKHATREERCTLG